MDNKKQVVPKLRFPEFEGPWVKKKLGDVGKVKMCKRVFSRQTTEFGEIPFYKIGTFGKQPNAYISKELYLDYKSRFSFPRIGDILISASGTLGRTVVYDGSPAYFQDSNIVWLDNNEVLITNSFLYYIYQIVNYDSEGGTIQRLYNSIISKASFYKPSLLEQKKIANFLSAIDYRIQALEKKKSLLEEYKKGVMQKIFKQEVRFRDEEGKEFDEWKIIRLGDLTYKVGKKNKENRQLPIYSINNKEGFLPQGQQFEGMDSNDRGYDISLYKIIKEKTFAYNPARINVGSIGYSGQLNDVIVSSLYVCFKTSKELEDSYLLHFLDSYNFRKGVLRNQEGGVRQYLFYDNFSAIKIPLPPNSEQIKIANFLSAIDKRIELADEKIELTKTYKKGLLQQMFV